MALLAELAERDASGEKAAIYAELKRLGGVPMVALIFRHLATLSGGIEWAWGVLEPAWRRGHLQEAAWRIARSAPLVPIAAIPREALAPLGVDAGSLDGINAVLHAYNRANPENMLSVLCLLRRIAGGTSTQSLEPRVWTPPPPHGPLAPMIDVATMPRELAQLLDLVATPGEAGGPRVIQSLYRHFGDRPGFLALAVTLLRERLEDGSVERGVTSINAAMGRVADDLARSLSAPPAPDPRILPVLERFGGAVIPQMIVVGRLLAESLPAD